MASRRGSWPALLASVAAFLLLFYWQRSRSTFLRIEQERPAAAALAEQAGVDVADVLAMRDRIGLEATPVEWAEAVAAFAAGEVAPDELVRRRFVLMRERFAARR